MLQKAVLFKGTIADNLKWGNENAAQEDMEEALRISQAKEFVDQKQGRLEFRIEQGGRNLSGGQKQRLTIARALVRRPEILILDDSASALDFATDAALRSAIHNMKEKPTVFIVSQRAASIRFADQIIVLDEGEITQVSVKKDFQGRHIGRRLLETLEEEGKKEGVVSFFLEVRQSNAPAIHLYQNCGFSVQGIRKNFYENPREDGILMEKKTASLC